MHRSCRHTKLPTSSNRICRSRVPLCLACIRFSAGICSCRCACLSPSSHRLYRVFLCSRYSCQPIPASRRLWAFSNLRPIWPGQRHLRVQEQACCLLCRKCFRCNTWLLYSCCHCTIYRFPRNTGSFLRFRPRHSIRRTLRGSVLLHCMSPTRCRSASQG